MTESQDRRQLQLALFEEYVTVPRWMDLTAGTRKEAVQQLAHLLSVVQHDIRSAQDSGGSND